MASLSIVVSSFCQGSQGYVALDSLADAPGVSAAGSYTWTVINQASGQDYGNGDYCQAGSQVAVPDGAYQVRVFATYDDNTRATSAPRPATVSCGTGGSAGSGGAAALSLDSLTHTDAPTAAGTGTVTVKASGGQGQLYATLGGQAAQPITAGVAYTFPKVTPGTYLVDLHDSATPTNAYVRDTVTVAVHPVLGCTDPSATNPTPGATADDGSCVYTPPPPVPPYLAVPLLQALRFVVRGQGGGVDSTLFCEQPRAGQQVRPYFFQAVQSSDLVRVQVLTSYAAVTATIRQHTSGQVAATVSLQQVLTLEGPAAPLAVLLTQDVATGLTRLSPAQGTELPASLLASPRLTLAGGATGTYRLTQVVPGSVLALADYVVLNRPWVAPGAGGVTASWLVSGAGFNVWEADLPISSLAAGTYQVQLRATRAGLADVVADSEPFAVRATWPNTVAVDFTNADNCYRTVFSTGFAPRLRVKATLFRQANGGAVTSYDDSAATTTVLASTATRVLTFETYGLPAWLHEKLFLACRLDALRLDGVAYAAPAAYAYELPRAYPLGGGHVDLQQVEFLGAGNGDDAGLTQAGAPANALQLSNGEYVLLHG